MFGPSVRLTPRLAPGLPIGIPPDQYARALKAIRVTFLTAPVLSPAAGVALPLPAEQGYGWSWLSRSGDAWTRSGIAPPNLSAGWADRLEIREGWLELGAAGDDGRTGA